MNNPIILFLKSRVGPYLRGGRMVGGYDNKRTKQAAPAPGQLSLFVTDKPLPPNPFKGKDPVTSTPDMFPETHPSGLTVTFGGRTYPVASLNDASRKWNAFRDAASAGVSDLGNGVVVRNQHGTIVGRISYNGRIWNPDGSEFVGEPDLTAGAKHIAGELQNMRKPEPAPTDDIPAGHSRKFYVTMIRDPGPRQRVARLAGPFDQHEDALTHVDRARAIAEEVDPRAVFDAFGTSAITSDNHRPGTLNGHLGIGEKPADDDAKLLDGFPAGARFQEGKGQLGRGQWFVAHADGKPIGNLMATKRDAAANARQFLEADKRARAEQQELDAHYAKVAEKLKAGKEISDADLSRLGLKSGRARFDYLSPVVQKLFGISKAKVREAMGSALSESYNDMGTKSWWANPRKALANAAAYAAGGAKSSADPVGPRSDLHDGTVIRDGKGKLYRVHYQRNALVLAHPIINGKAQVSADTTIRFWTNPEQTPSGESDRTDPIYSTGQRL